jgi:hypothetical protein
MYRMFRQLCAAFLFVLCAGPVGAAPPLPPIPSDLAPSCAPGSATGVLPSGALSLICIPYAWNGAVVVYAHGYVDFNEPLQLLPDGPGIPALVLSEGFAFATTSYRQNGLAILEGADDIRELMATLTQALGPRPAIIAGASEGGLVTTLLGESPATPFVGGLAACGPIGNFRQQIDYFGDFRVVFDYFFPGLIPGEAHHIPTAVIRNWSTTYVPAIVAALSASPARTRQMLNVLNTSSELLQFVPNPFLVDPVNPADRIATTLGLLRYSIFATNDAFEKLGGNPFDNQDRVYGGTGSVQGDADLNRHVHRFNAQKAALDALQAYETSGAPTIPLVTLHTTGDEIIPFAHESLYGIKHAAAIAQIPVDRPGHCNFTPAEMLGALARLVP